MAGLLEDYDHSIVTSEAPRSNISGQEVAQPYQEMAHALDKAGDALEAVATPLAQRAGAQAVTRDANGNIQVEHNLIFGNAGVEYKRAVQVAALAEGDGAAKRADIALRQQYRDDPEGYLVAADALNKKMTQQMTDAAGPIVGNALRSAAEQSTTQTYKGLLNEKERLDLERADGAIKAGLSSASDDAMAMARGGAALDDPALQQAVGKYQTLLDERMTNPRMSYSPAQRDFDMAQFQSDITANRFLYHTANTYKTGGAQAAEQEATDILTSPAYKLSQEQRESFYHKSIGEIRAMEAIRKQDIGEARAAFNELTMASATGARIDSDQVEQVANAFRAANDPGGAARVYSSFARKPLNDDFGRQPLTDQTQQLRDLQGAADPGANGMGMINAPYTAPFNQPGEKGIVSPSQVYSHLLSAGATKNEALLLTSAAGSESSFNPTAVHDNGNGYGLFGHNLQRLDLRGKDWRQQSEAALAELRSRPEGASVNSATTPEQLAIAEMHFEQPRGYTQSNPTGGDNYTGRLNTIRNFAQQVGGASATAGAGGNAPVVIGDSLGSGLRQASGVGSPLAGDTMVGRSPSQVLKAINAFDPKMLAGKPVVLSSGASNDVGNVALAADQISALKAKGVDPANITLLGVGDRQDFQQGGVNAKLQSIAQASGAKFLPIDPATLGADRVHPASYTGLLSNVGVAATNPANTAWLATNRQLTMNSELWDGWKTAMKDYSEKGIRPNNNLVTQIVDGARASGNAALLEQIGHDMGRIGLAQEQSQKPLGQQQADITRLNAAGEAGQLSIGQASVLKDLQTRYSAISKGLEDNPIATTAANFPDRVKTPDPLDIKNPDNLVAGLKQRAQIAQFAAQNWQTGPLAALDKQDIVQVKAALQSPDPREKAGIYGAIATLPEDVRGATLRKLGGNEPAGMAEAAAGSLMGQAPAIGLSIFRGQAAMATDKRYDPETENEGKAAYLGDLDRALPASTFTLQDRTDPSGAYSTMETMIKSRYADLSAQAGQTTYSRDRLNQAVTDVTGGILSHNGGTLIAPARGMTQPQFDGVLRGLTDNDFDGVRTLGGQPITADYVRGNGQLESAGDGRYFVKLGRDPLTPIYAYGANRDAVYGAAPGKFILDLRNRSAAPSTMGDHDLSDLYGGG